MPEEFKAGCQRPKIEKEDVEDVNNNGVEDNLLKNKGDINMLKVGNAAPDFTTSAYYKGKFMNIKLSEYLGKWVLLCFYPGDFTFV